MSHTAGPLYQRSRRSSLFLLLHAMIATERMDGRTDKLEGGGFS